MWCLFIYIKTKLFTCPLYCTRHLKLSRDDLKYMGGCMWIICKYHAFYIRDLYKVHWGYRGMTYHCVYFSIIYKNQICKQPHYPLMEYHSAIKKNGMLPFVTIWTLCYMNLSQIKTNTIWSQLYVEPKKQTKKTPQACRYREQTGCQRLDGGGRKIR